MTEQCSFCGHKHLKSQKTRYLYQRQKELMVVERVPCLQCEYCGEQYFEASVLKKIEADFSAVALQKKQPLRTMKVAVEDYAGI